MTSNATYMATMEKQLKKWDADVEALAAAYVKDLRANRATAQQAFKEMQAAGQAAGAKVQAQMSAAYETMQKNYEKAVADLKK